MTGPTWLHRDFFNRRGQAVLDLIADRILGIGRWAALPTAAVAFRRGLAWVDGDTDVADGFRACFKSRANAYAWGYAPIVLVGTATWDPGSIASGGRDAVSVTVTGAAVGDPAVAGFTSIATADWDVNAIVSGADTVRVHIVNLSGGAVDLGSGTVRALVVKSP